MLFRHRAPDYLKHFRETLAADIKIVSSNIFSIAFFDLNAYLD